MSIQIELKSVCNPNEAVTTFEVTLAAVAGKVETSHECET